MPANGLAAGQTGDGLIDHSLKNGGGKVFFGGTFVDKRLNIRFGENAAPGSDSVQRLITFGIFV